MHSQTRSTLRPDKARVARSTLRPDKARPDKAIGLSRTQTRVAQSKVLYRILIMRVVRTLVLKAHRHTVSVMISWCFKTITDTYL